MLVVVVIGFGFGLCFVFLYGYFPDCLAEMRGVCCLLPLSLLAAVMAMVVCVENPREHP